MLTVHSKCILSKEFRVVYQGQGQNDHLSRFVFSFLFSPNVTVMFDWVWKLRSHISSRLFIQTCALCKKTVHLSLPFVPLNHNMNQASVYIYMPCCYSSHSLSDLSCVGGFRDRDIWQLGRANLISLYISIQFLVLLQKKDKDLVTCRPWAVKWGNGKNKSKQTFVSLEAGRAEE